MIPFDLLILIDREGAEPGLANKNSTSTKFQPQVWHAAYVVVTLDCGVGMNARTHRHRTDDA